jgi:outer membrane receptor protein involved in Fe transport
MGFESQLNQHFVVNSAKINLQGAVGLRNDLVANNELSNTLNRSTTITQIQLGDINETNTYGFLTAEISSGKWKINPALRLDYFSFEYQNKLVFPYHTKSESQAKWSPKLNFSYQQNNQLNWYLKLGKGFHSNDTRVVLEQNSKAKLPNSYGADIGVTWKPLPRILFNSAFWLLNLEQEFVYVGDAGIVEPSGKSKRKGIDLGLRYQLNDQLFFNADFTQTVAKSSEEPKGADFIPLAPKTTFVTGLNWMQKQGFSGAISSRYLGDRPANEDYSIVAKGYFITDINLSYSFSSGIETGCIVQNVFNTAWNETQFATESRLRTEPESVTEIHFTPGTPFNGRLFLRYKF